MNSVVGLAFLDELEKICEVNLAGLSHSSVERLAPAQPMETQGLAKALKVLDRAQSGSFLKLAAPRVPFNPDLPEINRVTGAKKKGKKPRGAVESGKSLGGHILGGMGIGRLAGEIAHGPLVPASRVAAQALHGKRWYGAVAGGAVGAGEFARKRIQEHRATKKEKKAFVGAGPDFTPGLARKSGNATAKLTRFARRTAGPGAVSRLARIPKL